MNPKLSIIIPCFNEAENLPTLITRLEALPRRYPLEVILVDNGSSDETPLLLQNLPERIRALRLEENQSYGAGILAGLQEAKGEYLSWTHADLQTDPMDIIRAFKKIESMGFPRDVYIKGARTGRPLFDQAISAAMSLVTSIILGEFIWEINAMPNVFHRSFLLQWSSPPKDYQFELYSFYLAQRFLKILRFDVQFPARTGGASTWNHGLFSKFKMGIETIRYALKLRAESLVD